MATLKLSHKLFIQSKKLIHLRPLVSGIHSTPARCGNDIDKALQIKEASQVDNRAVLQPQEWEQKQQMLKGLITVIGPDDISKVSGVPLEHIKGRRVKIGQTVKNSMQSGTDNVGIWQLSFETRERWENPLMGWSSTGDPLSNMAVEFRSEETAIAFAEKNGWEWFLEAPKQPAPKVKSYGFNFSWDKRSRVSTK